MPAIARLLRDLSRRDSAHRQIALNFVLVSFFVFAGKSAGAFKEMAVAWKFGVGSTVDAYAFLFTLLSWPAAVWFGVLSSVLIPMFNRFRQSSPGQLNLFLRELLGLTLLVGAVLCALVGIGLPLALGSGFGGLSTAVRAEAMVMTSGLTLMLPFGLLIGTFSAWTMAEGHHRNTLFEAVPSLVLLAALLTAPAVGNPLVWATVIGFLLHALCLAGGLWRDGKLVCPKLSFQSSAWTDFFRSVGIMVVGQLVMSFTSIVDQLLAAEVSTGGIATLGYASRVLMLLSGMGALAISRSTLPVFTQARHVDPDSAARLAKKWALMFFSFGIVLVPIFWAGAPTLIRLLFERGSFVPADTTAVVAVFRYSLFQLPFYFSSLVLVSILATFQLYRYIALGAVINFSFKLIVGTLAVREMGLNGLVLSTAAMYVLSFAYLSGCFLAFVALPRKTPR